MNEETIQAVIKFINSGLVNHVHFFGGEPLTNWPAVKKIIDGTLIRKGASNNYPNYNGPYDIVTNGTLLTPSIINYFKERQTKMAISLDGTKATQDYWRSNSYDAIIKNIDLLKSYPGIKILKTLANPKTLYRDVAHIRDLGFKNVFMNLLDPYSHIEYSENDIEEFKRQYRRVILNLDSPAFMISDYHQWKNLVEQVHSGNKKMGCGFYNRGLAVGPKGKLYPCLQAPCWEDFAIGDIWNGIDKEKEEKIRNVEKAPICVKCVYQFNKCPETMYRKHGKFGVDPPVWHMKFELAKIRIIEDLEGLPHLRAACEPKFRKRRKGGE